MPESNHIIKKNAPDRTDILIVGAGPAGIFCALGLLGRGDGRHITIVEKGLPIEHRSCPKAKTGVCVHCNPCRITTGFSGAGAPRKRETSLSKYCIFHKEVSPRPSTFILLHEKEARA